MRGIYNLDRMTQHCSGSGRVEGFSTKTNRKQEMKRASMCVCVVQRNLLGLWISALITERIYSNRNFKTITLHLTLWCLRYGVKLRHKHTYTHNWDQSSDKNTAQTHTLMLSWSMPAGSVFRHINTQKKTPLWQVKKGLYSHSCNVLWLPPGGTGSWSC